jgi:hypothetical protein
MNDEIVVVTDFNEAGETGLYGLTVGDVSLLFDGVDHE